MAQNIANARPFTQAFLTPQTSFKFSHTIKKQFIEYSLLIQEFSMRSIGNQ